jgi:hypothetical protein
MVPIRSPETSVRNYHHSPCNNPEERSSRLLRSGSLKSPTAMTWNTIIGQETLSIATKTMIVMFWVSRTWLPKFHKNCFLHSTDNLPAQTLCAWCHLSPVDGRVAVTDSWVQLKRDGIRWRTGGEVKGKLANGVCSQYPSHYLGTWCIQHYYRWCTHLSCQ